MEKPLTELREGEKGAIKKILSGHCAGHCHGENAGIKQLENLGIRIGKEVAVVSIQPFGPIMIEIDGRRTAIGRGRAAKIYVEI